jgi:hypothetical protein
MIPSETSADMAHSSRRKRRKHKKHYIIYMQLKEGTTDRQECPKCPAVIIGSPIPDRICWKCSPEESAKQLKRYTKDLEEVSEEPAAAPKEKMGNVYDKTEAFLKKWHNDNDCGVPVVFQNWSLYFFSRGSFLREWSRCMNYWMKNEICAPVTDMTPGKELERKIKERREASGTPGPGFKTLEEKVANLRGEPQGKYSSQVSTPTRGIQQVSHKEPAIPRPHGEGGTEFLVV